MPAAAASEPQAIVVSHRFDPVGAEQPYEATLRLTGRRVGVEGRPGPGDSFSHEERVRVVPGSGPITVTSTVHGVAEGLWEVDAELVGPASASGRRGSSRTPGSRDLVERAGWSWRRWTPIARAPEPVRSRWALLAPLARSPGVLPGSFTLLAAVGIVTAFVTQAVLLDRLGLPVATGLAVSFVGFLAGLAGAKLWYMRLRGRPWRETIGRGWAVDGFLVVAPLTAIAGVLVSGLAVGPYLDAIAPGIFFAVAIGRVGCFLTGCCAGRVTAGRGIWSSDQKIGARRIPTQLLESLTGLGLGLASLLLVTAEVVPVPGLVFVAALLVYAAARQALLRLRTEARPALWSRAYRVT